ncbi:33984_t:CDS:2, partial [Gigaspora margarita]
KASTSWTNLKDGIIKKIKSENETTQAKIVKDVLKINKKRNWYIKGLNKLYQSKVDSSCLKNYDKTKKRALEMKDFRRDKNNSKEKDQSIPKVIAEFSNIDINFLAKDFARLKICHIDQKLVKIGPTK